MSKLFSQALEIRQSKAEVLTFRVDVSESGDSALPEGFNHASFTDNGTGDYTITLDRPAKRTLVVIGVCPIGVADVQFEIDAISASAVGVKFTNNSGTATDADFHLTVLAYHSNRQY